MTTDTEHMAASATVIALRELDSIPRNNDEPVFNAPWEAEAFALSLSLHEKGVFTWKEWAHALSNTIRQAQDNGDPDLGDTYYLHWLNTLEKLVIDKQIGDARQLEEFYTAWDTAARNTAHGLPIELP